MTTSSFLPSISDVARQADDAIDGSIGSSSGVAAFPPLSNKDLTEDRHMRERGYLVELEHPEVGKRTHAGIPWTMSGTPCKVRKPAPLRGADTEDVLCSLLGYTKADIQRLTAAEILI